MSAAPSSFASCRPSDELLKPAVRDYMLQNHGVFAKRHFQLNHIAPVLHSPGQLDMTEIDWSNRPRSSFVWSV
jgi:hypothetical protein